MTRAFDVVSIEDLIAAEAVSDPAARAPDFEYVAEPEEFDFVWRMVRFPLEALGCDLSLSPNPGCTEEEEAERFRSIEAWIEEAGGFEQALSDCPPIVIVKPDERVLLVDGRHRCALAYRAGIRHLDVMLGLDPEMDAGIQARARMPVS